MKKDRYRQYPSHARYPAAIHPAKRFTEKKHRIMQNERNATAHTSKKAKKNAPTQKKSGAHKSPAPIMAQ